MNFPQKPVALITGASSGIGKDLALRMLKSGYFVYGLARRVENMRDIEDAGGVALSMDLASDASMVSAVDRILHEQGKIDILVNSAGYGQMGAIEDVPLGAARQQMDVNLFGAARLVQLCLPAMRAQRAGKIINVSSIGGRCAFPLGGWYHASKFALEGYSDSLRMEVKPFGIDVIVIEPGGTESEWMSTADAEMERYSSKGAYSNLVSAATSSSLRDRKLPPAGVVTDVIMKAIKSRNPKARFLATRGAGMIIFLRKVLSDRMFDRIVMRQF
ncbi:oxidoreductase [Streptomyces fagopyri]